MLKVVIRRRFFALALMVAILSGSYLLLKEQLVIKDLRIHYPLNFLRSGPELLDPKNTETIWEYYLLENLSCGLVRDSARSATGYEGCLSDIFHQSNSRTWVFHIRDLKWSDGSTVSSSEIIKWIENIRASNSRHVKFLKLIEKVQFDEEKRNLKLIFSTPVDSGILHELSLADAGLLPPDYQTKGWSKTVGPYKVVEWNSAALELKLAANKYSPLFDAEMPQAATYFFVADVQQRGDLFRKFDADIVPHTATGNPGLAEELRSTAAQEYIAYPTHIAFFYFNRMNPNTEALSSRKAFVSIIREFQENFRDQLKEKYNWNIEKQMVPEGFSGRLSGGEKVDKLEQFSSALPKEITITVPETFRLFPLFSEALKQTFKNHGTELSVEYQTSKTDNKKIYAQVYTFVGNQLDSSGSWAFLTSEGGAFQPWLSEFQGAYDAVFGSLTRVEQQQAIVNLHKEVLDKAIAVPLTVTSVRYFLSSKVDVSRWNKFDARVRLYEIR